MQSKPKLMFSFVLIFLLLFTNSLHTLTENKNIYNPSIVGNLENLNSGVDYIVNKDENIIDRGVTASEDKNSEIKVHYYDNLLNEPKVPVEMIDAKLNNIKKKHSNKQHTSSSDSDNLVDINTSNLNANLIQKANPEFTTKNWIYQNPDTGQHLEKNETSIKDRFLVKNFYGSNYFTFDYSFLNNFTKTESSLQVKSFYQKFYIRNINKLNNKRLSCFDFSVNILSDASKHFSHDEFAVVTLTFTNLNKDDKNYLHFHLDSNLASDSEEKLSLLNKNIINISKNVVSFKEKEDVKVTKLNLVYQFSLEDRNLILNLTDDMEVLLGLTFFSTFNNTSFNETAANDIAKQEPTAKKRYESLHFFGLNELKLKFNFEEIFTAVNSNTTDSNVYNSRTAGSTETSFLHDIRFVFGISFGLFVLLATFFGILFCYLKRERKNANNLEKNDVGLDSSNGSSNIFNVVIPDIEESENKKLSSSEDLNSTERIQPIYNLIKFDKIQEEQITKNEWLSPEDRRSNNVTNSSSDISYNNKELKVNNTSSKKFKEYICKKNYKTKKADEINLNLGDILIIDQVFDDGWGFVINLTTEKRGFIPNLEKYVEESLGSYRLIKNVSCSS